MWAGIFTDGFSYPNKIIIYQIFNGLLNGETFSYTVGTLYYSLNYYLYNGLLDPMNDRLRILIKLYKNYFDSRLQW